MTIPAPVFVFGIARSGTNLIARMLDAHPRIAVALDPLMPLFRIWRNRVVAETAPESVVARFDFGASFHDYYFAEDGPALLDVALSASTDISVPHENLLALRDAVRDRAALEAVALAEQFVDWRGDRIIDLFNAAFAIIGAHRASRGAGDLAWVGIKELWTVEYAAALARAFTSARFILIHRDPRAVVASLTEMARRDESQAAHLVSYMRHWRKHVALAERFARTPAFAGRVLVVRYEDVVATPQTYAEELAAFLGMPFSEAMLRPGGDWYGNSSFGPNRNPIDRRNLDRWRSILSSAMISTVEFHCAPEMRILGYDLVVERNALNPAVAAEVSSSHRAPGKWRSDGGDPGDHLAWEVLRHHLLSSGAENWPEDMVRRCFLFTDMYKSLLQQDRGS
jgi:hypothetical protein